MDILIDKGNEDLQKHPGLLVLDKFCSYLPFSVFDTLSNKTANPAWIPNSSIVKAAAFLQSFGMTDFNDINEMNNDTLFTEIIGRQISPETLRQRMNFLAKEQDTEAYVDRIIVEFLKSVSFEETMIDGTPYICLDIDVTPFANPGVKKEGISCTYKMVDGYAPIMAYLGRYALCFDLRKGSQHSENGAVEFMDRCFKMIKRIGIPMERILVRVDSGHDASDFLDICMKNKVRFIVKRNHRRAKYAHIVQNIRETETPIEDEERKIFRTYYQLNHEMKPVNTKYRALNCVFQLVEQHLAAENTKWLIPPEEYPYELHSYWTNLEVTGENGEIDESITAQTCVFLYRKHATSEQYHSELKTDMDMELLPSKYFATNKLFLQLSAFSFNMLRRIGDEAVRIDDRLQHHKHRRTERIRLRTVIDKICTMACRITRHARRLVVKFGRKALFYDTFARIYHQAC